ncbi:hypothetical protein ACS2Q0_25345, partial [Bacillus cereus group sp. Bce010]
SVWRIQLKMYIFIQALMYIFKLAFISKKIILWYAHENWDFGVQIELEDFMLYIKEVLHFIGYDDAQRSLIYSSLIVVDASMRSGFTFLKNEYDLEIVLWKEG